jgi:hypothetical protein
MATEVSWTESGWDEDEGDGVDGWRYNTQQAYRDACSLCRDICDMFVFVLSGCCGGCNGVASRY